MRYRVRSFLLELASLILIRGLDGTASDVSFLIDFLPAYLFPTGGRSIRAWGVAGKSLGGHSAWLALAHGKGTFNGVR